MKRVWVVGLVLAACAPPVEGAACLTSENCPQFQQCSSACRCSLEPTGTCSGYAQASSLSLDGPVSSAVVQVSSRAEVVAVSSSDGQSENLVRLFAADGGAWTRLREFQTPRWRAPPVALSPGDGGIVFRNQLGTVMHSRVSELDTVTILWVSDATALAMTGDSVIASFATSLGTRRKTVGESATAMGALVDARSADELQLSNDGQVVAARFGSDVQLFAGDAGGAAYGGVTALDLSADGRSVALVRDTGIEVAVGPQRSSVPLRGVGQVALDGNGRRLLALGSGVPTLFALDGGTWVKAVELPLDAGVAANAAFTDDGAVLFVSVPSEQRVLVFRPLR